MKGKIHIMRLAFFILAFGGTLWRNCEGKAASAPWVINDSLDYEHLTPPEKRPEILNTGQEIKTIVGSSVVLPCDVVKLGKYNIVWQRGNKIVWVLRGDLPSGGYIENDVISDDGIEIANTSLFIQNATTEYSGNYSCEVRDAHQRIQHKLIVQVPPTVKLRHGNFLSKFEGNRVTLACNATGVPTPSIHWEKDDRILQARDSETFVIEAAERDDEGIYTCVANNGIGEAALAHIVLQVDYAPEVEAVKSIVYSGVGYNVDLRCTVKASPEADVAWFKVDDPDTPLTFKEGMEKNNRYYLSIQPIHIGDFGEYICHASNFWGNDSGTVELTGRPIKPVIRDVRRGDESGQYIVTWEVESYSSIASYDVFYKEGPDDEGEWANVTVPGQHSNSMYHNQFYTLEDIAANASLLVKVKATNEFGDSDWSTTSSFVASESDEHQKIKLVTRATSKLFFESGDSEADNENAEMSAAITDNSKNTSSPSSTQDDASNSTSSSGFPNLTPAQKKAQMVALITAISLSSFFF